MSVKDNAHHTEDVTGLRFSDVPRSKLTGKPVIHFAHANGVPSWVYQPIFDVLSAHFTIEYIAVLGFDNTRTNYEQPPTYPVDNHWRQLVKQVLASVKRAQKKHQVPVIGLGHSLGALCTLKALYQQPQCFAQIVLMDPPIIYGTHNFVWHLAKLFSPILVDKMSPAGISKHRRDVWESRAQARALLSNKTFFKNFDKRAFEAYMQHGLRECDDGKVTLTVPKDFEVAVFRYNPSWFWLTPNRAPQRPTTLLIGKDSLFYKKGFPQKINKRLHIPFRLHAGGHMFPLEYPDSVAQLIIDTVVAQASSSQVKCPPTKTSL